MFAVVESDAAQHQHAMSDSRHPGAIDAHRGFTDALHDGAHTSGKISAHDLALDVGNFAVNQRQGCDRVRVTLIG